MASRRTYTPADQAQVAVMLQANQGNVKRTAREANIPPMTVRDWKQKWGRDGFPEPVSDALPAAIEDVSGEMNQARSLAVGLVITKLREGSVSAKDAAWIASIFTDKINLIRGLATSRSETVQIALPDTKELAKALAQYVAATVESAVTRNDEIEYAEDAEWTEQSPKELATADR